MKSLREYYEEITTEMISEHQSEELIVQSDNNEERKRLYEVKRAAEKLNILNDFSYNRKTKDAPASAKFVTTNVKQLRELISNVGVV